MFFRNHLAILNFKFNIFSLHLLQFLKYLPIILFFYHLLFCLGDSTISFCMEQECNYVVNNEGNVQLHPVTGDPLQNCKTSKSDYVVAMETIERVVKQIGHKNPTIEVDNSDATDCKECK
jgi:hypothetical protein